MENAALSCLKHIPFSADTRVVVFCGRGNNGGDGLAVVRHLMMNGIDTAAVLVGGNDFRGDALINYNILKRMKGKIIDISEISSLEYFIRSYDIVIDAIYGTGIHGAVTGAAYDAIENINKYSRFTLSVDIPSGINADNGHICGICVKADVTVTFAAYKFGLVLYPGCDYTGRIFLENISIPQYIIDEQDIQVNLIDNMLLRKLCPKRESNSHKGDYGKIFIVGGCTGMTGAVTMASQAALYSGGGLITAGVPESLNAVFENKLTEVMSYPLADNGGNISTEAIDSIIEKANACDVILFGVGIGRSEDIFIILKNIFERCRVPIIIDADGLYALSRDIDILQNAVSEIIITPHTGEFSRLIGKSTEDIERARMDFSREFAEKYGITLILKGSKTIVACPSGEQFVNINANAGMATGGSGDVLAGMLSSFVARGMTVTDAAVFAVGMHGLAGDICMRRNGIESVTAGGIIGNIGGAFKEIGADMEIS